MGNALLKIVRKVIRVTSPNSGHTAVHRFAQIQQGRLRIPPDVRRKGKIMTIANRSLIPSSFCRCMMKLRGTAHVRRQVLEACRECLPGRTQHC